MRGMEMGYICRSTHISPIITLKELRETKKKLTRLKIDSLTDKFVRIVLFEIYPGGRVGDDVACEYVLRRAAV